MIIFISFKDRFPAEPSGFNTKMPFGVNSNLYLFNTLYTAG